MVKRIHVIGRKNSGKTTLICELVKHLFARGVRVGTIKHTHHHHELDTPGKDSYRHSQAGAAAVGILSPGMNAVFWPAVMNEDISGRYDRLLEAFRDCDVVLVEGDSQTEALKIEVWRADVSDGPLAVEDKSIHAVITDDPTRVSMSVWSRSDVRAIATRLVELSQERL